VVSVASAEALALSLELRVQPLSRDLQPLGSNAHGLRNILTSKGDTNFDLILLTLQGDVIVNLGEEAEEDVRDDEVNIGAEELDNRAIDDSGVVEDDDHLLRVPTTTGVVARCFVVPDGHRTNGKDVSRHGPIS
jgi:hypothetical protein